jgi:hypothetical protein
VNSRAVLAGVGGLTARDFRFLRALSSCSRLGESFLMSFAFIILELLLPVQVISPNAYGRRFGFSIQSKGETKTAYYNAMNWE